jgi:NADH-quinone oxidoreductase subunit L
MTVPLMILAVLSVIGGYVGVPQLMGNLVGWHESNAFEQFLEPVLVEPERALAHASSGGFTLDGLPFVAPAVAEASEGTSAHKVVEEEVTTGAEWGLMGISVLAALIGISVAYRKYMTGKYQALPDSEYKGIHKLVYRKYYVDEIYDYVFVRSLVNASRKIFWKVVDVRIIDGIVNGTAAVFRGFGIMMSKFQTGFVQNYALAMAGGMILIVWYVLHVIG